MFTFQFHTNDSFNEINKDWNSILAVLKWKLIDNELDVFPRISGFIGNSLNIVRTFIQLKWNKWKEKFKVN